MCVQPRHRRELRAVRDLVQGDPEPEVGRVDAEPALGLDLKALQYAEGKVFVDTVVREVGMTGFNRVWESAETLPTRQEIREPLTWVHRISGTTAIA